MEPTIWQSDDLTKYTAIADILRYLQVQPNHRYHHHLGIVAFGDKVPNRHSTHLESSSSHQKYFAGR